METNSFLEYFRESVNNFTTAVTTFLSTLKNVDQSNPLAVRKVNDRMTYLERYFIDPRGLPNRPDTK